MKRIIAGPCQHESFEHSLKIAMHCESVCTAYGFDYYFKASYDKANRTSVNGKRGLGMEQTMRDFRVLKETLPGLKILTDVHTVSQVMMIKEAYSDEVDVIQIPAFLCRQTDLIVAACKTGKTVNIKKGQFLAPWDVAGILSKTSTASEVWITERGTSFGYNNLVVDFTGMQYIMDNFDCRFVFDATHAVQQPGGNGNSSSGNRNYVPGLCRAASAMGVDSFFLEVHPDPDNAPSDGPNMILLDEFEQVIRDIHDYSYSNSSKVR
jgi:2-dehydro-3-deoxyphosphooctonate aldolase (KDO 8-P synthase)